MTTPLLLIDIDGTLTDTMRSDAVCFVQALSDVFGFSASPDDYDWSSFEHVSDPGVVYPLIERRDGRPPTDQQQRTLVDRLVQLLEAHAAQHPDGFSPIAGAPAWLASMIEAPDRQIAIATGCYRESGLTKLRLAGFDAAEHLLASGSDAIAREDIFRLAMQRAGPFDKAVLLGDGKWDAATAHNLDIPFIGIAKADKADALRQHGAVAVFSDFINARTLNQAIDIAVFS